MLLLTSLLLVSRTQGGHGRCACCHNESSCERVCRLVAEEKKVQVNCWGMKCEDFCVPGPSHRGCQHCELVCDEADPEVPCVHSKRFVWSEWIPAGCPKMFTKKKLMKKTVTKKVPSYKWVVEDLCPKCVAALDAAERPAVADLPAPPLPDVRLVYGQPTNDTPEEDVIHVR